MKDWNRHFYALDLRRKNHTYSEIGDALGVSGSRAAQIVSRAEREESRPKDDLHNLSTRIANVFRAEGFSTYDTAKLALINGDIHPSKTANYGKISHLTALRFFELYDFDIKKNKSNKLAKKKKRLEKLKADQKSLEGAIKNLEKEILAINL